MVATETALQHPQFVRTLRVRDENRVGVLASVLEAIAQHGGMIGDIRTVRTGALHITRDIDVTVNRLQDMALIAEELEQLPVTQLIEIRDEVLSAHAGGKIRMVARTPVLTRAELERIYTPGVGAVVQRIADDQSAAQRYTAISSSVAIVTDGSAILGLGNLGPVPAMPVIEGKAALLASLVGISGIPILLSTQDENEIIDVVSRISSTFGAILLEDIAAPRCFDIEPALQARCSIPVFHDDQHGTAVVMLAALLSACRQQGLALSNLMVGQIGLGSAGLSIARSVMEMTGKPVLGVDVRADANARFESLGGITAESLDEIMRRCDVVIAASGQPGLIKESMVRRGQMLFPLSNPRPEIEPAEALAAGARLSASGLIINNLLAYPGLCRGLLDAGATTIAPEIYRVASKALVQMTSGDYLLPDPLDRSAHAAVARAVALEAVRVGIATREIGDEELAYDAIPRYEA